MLLTGVSATDRACWPVDESESGNSCVHGELSLGPKKDKHKENPKYLERVNYDLSFGCWNVFIMSGLKASVAFFLALSNLT